MNNRAKRARPALFALPLVGIGAAALLALTAGCNPSSPPAKAPEAPAGPTAVATEKPTTKVPIRLTVAQPGRVLAFEETPMYAKVAGYVAEWKADIGDTVKVGQPLALLSVPEMEVDLARKEALIGQAEAEVKLAKAAVAVAEKEEQRSKSQSERFTKAGTGVLNADSIEEVKYAYEGAKAKLEQAQADVDVKAAMLEVAKKDRDQVKTLLGYTTLTAPYAGVVTRRNVNRGDFVQPATQAKGDPLFVVQETDKVRVAVAVPESDADWVDDKADASFRVQALRGKEYKGHKVTRISWSLDSRERTLTAEIDLLNPDGELRPGMYVYATISKDHSGAWTLPASAVVTRADQTQGDKTFCFVVEGGKAVQTPVKVGARDDQRVQLLGKPREDGTLQAFTGDENVAVDASKLTDGQAVEAKSAAK